MVTTLLAGRALAMEPTTRGLVLVVLASAAWLTLVALEHRDPRLPASLIAAAIACVVMAAVVEPPKQSNDLWSYVMYGRTIAVHHASPYVAVPASFPHDPFLARVSPGWRHTHSIYGPVWSLWSALGALVAGGSAVTARLFFQGTAALAVGATALLAWQRTRATWAPAFVGLSPVVVLSVVNGGHNDAVLGLLVVGAVLLVPHRVAAAGVLLGLALLMKLTAGLAVLALLVWLWQRGRRRAAATLGAVALGVTAVGYAPAGRPGIAVLGEHTTALSRASVWQVGRVLWVTPAGGRGLLAGLDHVTALERLTAMATVSVLVVALYAALRGRRDAGAAELVAGGLGAYVALGAFVLPWYTIWMLAPLAVRARATLLTWVAAVGSAWLLVVYQLPRHALGDRSDWQAKMMVSYLGPVLLALAFITAVHRTRRGLAAST